MIPKIIHYCWFGGGAMPASYERYISQWMALHPDWEIKCWNETNSPMDLSYLQTAQAQKKWANMSNLVRFHALLDEGGIYLDTDMLVVKPMDELLTNSCFMGFEEGESDGSSFWVNNAIIGAEKGNVFIQNCYAELLASFDGAEDANLSAPRLVTQLLKEKYGLSRYGHQVLEGITLYPQSYFYPIHYNEPYKLNDLDMHLHDNTFAVHMWGRSWLTSTQLLKMLDDLRYDFNTVVSMNHSYQLTWHTIKNTGDALLYGLENGKPETAKPTLIHEIREEITSIDSKIGSIQQHTSQLTQEIEKLLSDRKKYEERILEKDNRVNFFVAQLDESQRELTSKLELIACLQKTQQAAQLEYATLLGEWKTENMLLRQDLNNKEAQIVGLTANMMELERRMEMQIRLLTDHKATLQQSLEEKSVQLKDAAAILEKQEKAGNQLGEENEELVSALLLKEQEINRMSLQMEFLQKERAQFVADSELKDVELQREKRTAEEAISQLAMLESEYREYKLVQEINNTELIGLLQNRADNYHREINWYQTTYENRNLLGIIKDKFLKFLYP